MLRADESNSIRPWNLPLGSARKEQGKGDRNERVCPADAQDRWREIAHASSCAIIWTILSPVRPTQPHVAVQTATPPRSWTGRWHFGQNAIHLPPVRSP